PTVSSITKNIDGPFHLTGTLIHGISEGASYGDDWQQFSNYPIVRINHSNGNTYYARTFNWSSTGVMTGATPLTTEYALPAGFPAGDYSLVVTPNGNPSDAVSKPLITSNPADQDVPAFTPASFSVTATGIGPLSYQWRKNGSNLTNGGNVSGATSAMLTFNSSDPMDSGSTIDCVVSNAIGNATSATADYTVGCPSDYNGDGFVTGEDFDAFVEDFIFGLPAADYNGDTFVTGEDFDEFVADFVAGC
ncbi:MAG: hypothetical protein IT360_20260, partial [Gemmatimonadaceae bacterium]|nr:hypothetical protein [Gemmatimonadaceae bacterium]